MLTLLVPPAITAQPRNRSVWEGSSATFTVAATGTAPVALQWRKDATNVLDATNTAFTLSNVQSNAVAGYDVVASNPIGSVTSAVARLSLTADAFVDGLVAYYPFNGNASDESGYDNDGIVRGATLGTNRFGVVSNSYVFSATGSYPLWVGDTISTSNSNGFPTSTNDVSISLWASLSLIGPDYHLFFANREGNQFQLGIGVFTGTNAPIEFYSGSLSGPDLQTAPLSWSLGKWYNIQLTRSANAVAIFRDGVALAQGNVTTGNEATPDKRILDFGWRTLPGAGNHPLWGQLDDIRIYNRALTDSEVQELFTREAVADGLFASAQLTSGGVFVRFPAAPNVAYSILYATNLLASSWQKLADVPSASTNRLAEVLDPSITNTAQRFYRIVAPPLP